LNSSDILAYLQILTYANLNLKTLQDLREIFYSAKWKKRKNSRAVSRLFAKGIRKNIRKGVRFLNWD